MYRCILLFLSFFIFLTFPDTTIGEELYPTFGIDSIEDVGIFEDHSNALVHWAKEGIKNAVLLNIDAHDDSRWIPNEKIRKLKRLYVNKEWEEMPKYDSAGDESLFNVGNFIYAAAKLGIVREIYWMIPFKYFSESDVESSLYNFLEYYSLSKQDINTFRMKNGRLEGKTNGIPLTIFGRESIPDIDKPIIVSIDADFFPPMSRAYGLSKAECIVDLFQTLDQKKYKIQDALIAYSIRGGFLPVINRWIGDQCVEILRNPGLIYEKIPDLWVARQQADTIYEQEDAEHLRTHCLLGLTEFKDDIPLMLYLAFSYLGSGMLDGAYDLAKEICLTNQGYCYGLADVGQCLLDIGNLDEAGRFFESAYSLVPSMTYRNINYANALKKAGRYKESLVYLKRSRSRNGSFPVDFFIGETYLDMGDEAAALDHFDRGKKHLDTEPYPSINNHRVAVSIGKAIAFYERKGLNDHASGLRNNPKLRR